MERYKLLSAGAAVAVTIAGFTLVAAPAHGKTRPVVVVANPDIVTRRISYADLNLASSYGELVLNRRVGAAIRSLCSEAIGGDDLSFTTKVKDRKCRNSAWSQATPQIERAVGRAHDIASTGTSTIAAAGITIVLPE